MKMKKEIAVAAVVAVTASNRPEIFYSPMQDHDSPQTQSGLQKWQGRGKR